MPLSDETITDRDLRRRTALWGKLRRDVIKITQQRDEPKTWAAEHAGVPKNTFYIWMRGDRTPGWDGIMRVQDFTAAYGCPRHVKLGDGTIRVGAPLTERRDRERRKVDRRAMDRRQSDRRGSDRRGGGRRRED